MAEGGRRDSRSGDSLKPGQKPRSSTPRRGSDRRAGTARAWARIAIEGQDQLGCWVLNESKSGILLESRDQVSPCPIVVGETYWLLLKPSAGKKAEWVAATVRHCKERSVGSKIYKFGMLLVSHGPAALGESPALT